MNVLTGQFVAARQPAKTCPAPTLVLASTHLLLIQQRGLVVAKQLAQIVTSVLEMLPALTALAVVRSPTSVQTVKVMQSKIIISMFHSLCSNFNAIHTLF